jgi:hypothetical protein
MGSGANAYDALGHTILLMPVSNELTGAGLPDSLALSASRLFNSGLVSRITGGTGYTPYPAPDRIGRDGVKSSARGPSDVKADGYVYPRIKADC